MINSNESELPKKKFAMKPLTKVFLGIFGMGVAFYTVGYLLDDYSLRTVSFLAFGAALPAGLRAFQDS